MTVKRTTNLVPAERMKCQLCGHKSNEKFFLWYEPIDRTPGFYCRTCRRKFTKEEMGRHRKSQKMDELVDAVNHAGRQVRPQLATISDLWTEMVDQFGGVDQVASFYKQQLMRAASSHNGAGSARVLASCANLARICAMSSQHEVAGTPVGRMTDDELTEELIRVLHQLPLAERRRLVEASEAMDVEYAASPE